MAASGRFRFNSGPFQRRWAWADRPPVPQDGGPFGPGTAREEARTPEALRLLGTVPLGRIVFTHRALPATRPVNHVVEGEDVVVRLDEGAARGVGCDQPLRRCANLGETRWKRGAGWIGW
ncbi:pyridoxamine 5'-phosphate oxidase family protein [Streptomyces xanthophaeus]|uniref:Uncharacterized protein n=1 Tax=Streptomyces xanthophaeus TaxID=67385 RepID=A0A919H233_9ACTN|nr:hypothetical protein Sxan_33680 [Streptomyces xanthophaeus]